MNIKRISKNIYDNRYKILFESIYMQGFLDGFGMKIENLFMNGKGDEVKEIYDKHE